MTFKDKVETAKSIVTIVAILVGGLWTYNLFIKERKQYPHANIEQKVSHVALSEHTNLLRVGIELSNTGSSRLLSGKLIIRIQQILPVPSCPKQGPCAKEEVNSALKEIDRKANRFSWPLIAEREHNFGKPLDIEPEEKDFIEYEFVVPTEIKAIRIYSYFRNDQKSKDQDEVGWAISSHYDFGKSKEERVK
jgi:hypothetical protein